MHALSHGDAVKLSKHEHLLPPKIHPPLACGMTMFGSRNTFQEVRKHAEAHHT